MAGKSGRSSLAAVSDGFDRVLGGGGGDDNRVSLTPRVIHDVSEVGLHFEFFHKSVTERKSVYLREGPRELRLGWGDAL